MKTVQAFRAPWNVVENISIAMLAYGVAHVLAGGQPRPWIWPLFFNGAVACSALCVLRWRAARKEAVRQRYMRTVEYSPLFEWLKVLGTIAIFGLWYLLVTTFLVE